MALHSPRSGAGVSEGQGPGLPRPERWTGELPIATPALTVTAAADGPDRQVRVLTWNLEWAKLTSWRATPILERLRSEHADVAVLTEAQLPLVREIYPHVVDAGPHPKARQPQGSKVVVASHSPLEIVDPVGSPDLPPHNFVTVDAHVEGFGSVRVIGVVIRWAEKRAYVDALPAALDGLVTDMTLLAGDYNLSMLKRTPLARDLEVLLTERRLRVATKGPWPQLEHESPLIDHIAVGPGLEVGDVRVWARHVAGEQRRITDHAGSSVDLRLA